jgi:uncharacterized membrane protein
MGMDTFIGIIQIIGGLIWLWWFACADPNKAGLWKIFSFIMANILLALGLSDIF